MRNGYFNNINSAAIIDVLYRIIITIREHIVADKSLTRGNVAIRTQKSTGSGIIIPRAEVEKEPFFFILP